VNKVAKMRASSVIYKQLPKSNNDPFGQFGKNSPNLVALFSADKRRNNAGPKCHSGAHGFLMAAQKKVSTYLEARKRISKFWNEADPT
jgi:hypothetical protein